MSLSSFLSSFLPVAHADAPEEKEVKEEETPQEEEAEEEEPEDVMPAIVDECEQSAKCAPLLKHFQHCEEKVNAGEGFKGEDCVEELPLDALRERLCCAKTLCKAEVDTPASLGRVVVIDNRWHLDISLLHVNEKSAFQGHLVCKITHLILTSPTSLRARSSHMNVFNPKILDASIRDVTSHLTDEQKADVLIYAMGQLQPERSRTLIENAVQSCLLIYKLSPANAAKARLMRAKARLAAGLHVGAHQDIQAILELEPEHPEAKSLMVQHVIRIRSVHLRPACSCLQQSLAMPSSQPLIQPHTTPGFSTEIWREIALWLPPRDLKSLLLVPHVLSRIASQLLFQTVDLHLGSDKFQSQRSADILTRIIVDPNFGSHVKTLRIFGPGREAFPITFQTGMLSNALPKMTNLKNVHCSMRWKDMYAFLRILETLNHRLSGLSLMPSDGTGELRFPSFKHIMQFSYESNGGNPTKLYEFLVQNKTSIRSLFLHNPNWTFPSDAISIRNLTHLDFKGMLPPDSRAFADIFENGHQLESLRLQCMLECTASSQFREYPTALPFLRHFAFSILGYRMNDLDLFPAIAQFLRDRNALRTLHLTVPSADWAQRRLGYDATVWGVLPSLTNLRNLSATLPKDVAAAVAMWLVPRGVQALSLQAVPGVSTMEFVSQLRSGLPPSLRYIELNQFHIEDVAAVVEQGFPMVRVVHVDKDYYTVTRSRGRVELEEWPKGRTQYHARDWLECYGCEEAEWRSPMEFL
ncbi:hypothetical protein A0H81_05645 [Grifola frondosa]|uniref:Ubiquinol-cytochrome C reductase hinge domain-containing protein n=1 Tax=Grifola frondosa TaxID=5627 RepID=A0A1C7MCY2_GRIFR|nr:hypothetical protein A0H81_05645 [Grifola frondosa]